MVVNTHGCTHAHSWKYRPREEVWRGVIERARFAERSRQVWRSRLRNPANGCLAFAPDLLALLLADPGVDKQLFVDRLGTMRSGLPPSRQW